MSKYPIVKIAGSQTRAAILEFFREKDLTTKVTATELTEGIKVKYIPTTEMKILELHGLLNIVKVGKENLVSITEKGQECAQHMNQINKILGIK